MDFIIEVLIDLILEGIAAGASSRKVPLAVRILLALVLVALFGGLEVLVLYIAYWTRHPIMWVLAVGFAAALVYLTVRFIQAALSPEGND